MLLFQRMLALTKIYCHNLLVLQSIMEGKLPNCRLKNYHLIINENFPMNSMNYDLIQVNPQNLLMNFFLKNFFKLLQSFLNLSYFNFMKYYFKTFINFFEILVTIFFMFNLGLNLNFDINFIKITFNLFMKNLLLNFIIDLQFSD